MKISKILCFIFGILLCLSGICLLFPAEGITLGGVKLEFPSLMQVLSTGEDEVVQDTIQMLSPEELLEQRMSSLQTQKSDEFHQFANSSPQRIYMPGDDETYLDDFFLALENAGEQHVRILHLGDSQLECDRISSSLREHYQQEFGGRGVGLVPALQTVSTYTLSQTVSPSESVVHNLVYGPADARAGHHRYGVMGQVNRVVGGTSIRLSARDVAKYPCSGGVQRVTVMASGSGGMSLTCSAGSFTPEETVVNDNFSLFAVSVPRGTDALTLSIHGTYDIYGIQLDGMKGVSLDNVPMRGCSGTIFTQIDAQTIAPFFQHEHVGLIILQYGGNSVPGCSGASSISSYMKSLRRQIALFRRVAPKAKMLFIGPADMATRIGGEMKTYEVLPQMVDSLRQMSLQEGIAFWDMFNAMGGKGSIVKWYRATPQLAGADFVHFTPKGAQKMADMLYGTLQLYYRFYRLRMGKESEHEMQGIEFRDAVAPVEGNGQIFVSELPARPHQDSLDSYSEFNTLDDEDAPGPVEEERQVVADEDATQAHVETTKAEEKDGEE